MEVKEDRRYSTEHEWILESGGEFVVGISDYAQRELGDVVFVELPQVGSAVSAGEGFANLESVKAVSDVYAPVSGKVTAVNEALRAKPELVNSAPYGDGWLVRLSEVNADELQKLMDGLEYGKFIAEVAK